MGKNLSKKKEKRTNLTRQKINKINTKYSTNKKEIKTTKKPDLVIESGHVGWSEQY